MIPTVRFGQNWPVEIGREREGTFLEYMGDSEEFLIWSPTSPAEGEELCKALDPGSAAGCDGVVPRVVKGVAQKLSGSLSHLFNCCTQESHYPACFKVGRVVPVFKGKGESTRLSIRPSLSVASPL